MSVSTEIADEVRPRLPRGVRLRHDPTRGTWVLLGPERLVLPDETALEVLQRCDGERTLATLVADLAEVYDAEPVEIRADVVTLLQDLRDQRMIEL